MSRLVMLGLLVGLLLLGATPGIADQRDCVGVPGGPFCQGGIGDPLTLAASGVLIPFISNSSSAALLQVLSPVADNPELHMFFYQANCNRIPISRGLPLTTNDVGFLSVVSLPASASDPATGNGLVAIARADPAGFQLVPLLDGHPIQARMYLFDSVTGRSRVMEPIILNTAEFPAPVHWWSPLRTGGDFFAPPQVPSPAFGAVQTDLILVCPNDQIQGGTGAGGNANVAFGGGRFGVPPFTDTNFPGIEWEFPSGTNQTIRFFIYDDRENPLVDITTVCNCVTFIANIATISPIYADPILAAFGTYTEVTSPPASGNTRLTFTGYTSSFTIGFPNNAFFARFNNGSQGSLNSPVSGPATIVNRR